MRSFPPSLPGPSSRRLLLRAPLAAAGAALLRPAHLFAQGGASPKVALVLGNSRYRQSPLRNPANDARAIAETLIGLGFDVSVRLDADRATMEKAIEAHVAALARRKATGVFYYAGHGVQLAWKNYLLPVDAAVASAADVMRQGYELNALVGGLAKAANPLNLIILDACRDNPFGSAGAPEHKGLSQMDAPPGTLLAYATAPGNTASDGEGANGLYTENLLREMRARGAKVEDVFKRVRLAVRRASRGAQIPWESTSLEDDFYFVAPDTPPGKADADRAREFVEELKAWEAIESAPAVTPIEAYLRRYPSGRFSELAQLQLDRLLAQEGEKPVQVAPSAGNPYTAGTARSDTAFKIGDEFRYRVSDRDSGAQKRRTVNRVTRITDQEVEFNDGRFVTDLLGNPRRTPDGRRMSAYQQQPLEFALGRQWVTRFRLVNSANVEIESEYTYRVTARERIRVPAGEFDCYRVEGKGTSHLLHGSTNTTLRHDYWMAPAQCRRAVKWEAERIQYARRGPSVLENDRYELESFRQS